MILYIALSLYIFHFPQKVKYPQLSESSSLYNLSSCSSVELDFKLQEDKLQPLMKRLCPTEETYFPALPYSQEAYSSTPKRKSKAESKKHARWKLWFL